MMTITKVIIHDCHKTTFGQLNELKKLLNASNINLNGVIDISCNVESDLRSIRIKISEIINVKSSLIYFEYNEK